jgi:hypothetical protein
MREMLNNPKTIDFNFDDVDVESMDLSDIVDLGDDVFLSRTFLLKRKLWLSESVRGHVS